MFMWRGTYVEALPDCFKLTGSSESELKSLLKLTFKVENVAQLLEFLQKPWSSCKSPGF